MDTNKMREQFEAWECDAPQGPQTDPMWFMYDAESNAYGLDKIQDRWEVWQASRQAVVVELPKFDDYPSSMERDMQGALRSAIEAQGLRAKP